MTDTAVDPWGDQPVTDADIEAHDAAWLEAKEQSAEDIKALRRHRAQRNARDQLRAEDAAGLAIPTGTRLDDFLARPLDPITHRIDQLWPIGGRIILTAQFKAGKTTLRDEVIRSLADGDPFLDQFTVNPIPGNIALLDLELGDHTLQRWLADHQIENTDRVNVWSLQGRGRTLDLRDDHTRSIWAGMLGDAGTSVLVIDCLRPILDALGMSEHTEAGLFLEALDALLADAGIGEALLIHHMGHVGERARGDSRLRDWPMAEWRLVRDKDDENEGMDNPASARYFTAYGRDVDHPQQELTYAPDTRRLTLRPGAADRKGAAKRRRFQVANEAILRVIAAQPGIGKRGLLTAISGHNPTINEAVELLVEDGLIRRHVEGQKHSYFPVEHPRETVKTTTVPTVPNRTPGTGARTVPGPLGTGTVPTAHQHDPGDWARVRQTGELEPPPCPECDHPYPNHDPGCPEETP